jgi:predicted cobalt transporter CbtA
MSLQRMKWAESTSSQGHSCILMRNKEINTYNADEKKNQIYWLKTVYIINSITNFDVRLRSVLVDYIICCSFIVLVHIWGRTTCPPSIISKDAE